MFYFFGFLSALTTIIFIGALSKGFDIFLLIGLIACVFSAISNYLLAVYSRQIKKHEKYFDKLKKHFPELKDIDNQN